MTDTSSNPPLLTEDQVLVLGRILEIQFKNPEAYPCPVEIIARACEFAPVPPGLFPLERSGINQAITKLIRSGLLNVDHSSDEFSYRHKLAESLQLDPAQLALMAVLMLHGPQTLEELLSRAHPLYPFQDYQHIAETLKSLQHNRSSSLVSLIPRSVNESKTRYQHCFLAESRTEPSLDFIVEEDVATTEELTVIEPRDRIDELEIRVAELEAIIDKLSDKDLL